MRLGLECSFQHATFNWAIEGSWVGFDHYYGAKFYENLARIAARGFFDMMFFGDAADTPHGYGGTHHAAVKYGFQWPKHDMTPMVPLLARAAPGIGFGLTMSTTYQHPFHVARLFATLDHLTQGRVAWNAVTSAYKNEAANWGFDEMMPHAERYARAREHLQVVKALWASVEPDAIILDRASGIFADPDKVHRIDHKGEYFSLPGPLPTMPSVQGGPPIIQAGQSPAGMDLCASFADIQFASRNSIAGMRAHRADLDARLLAKGRGARDVGVMWVLRCCVGETRDQALEKDAAWLDSLPPRAGILYLSSFFGVDFSQFDGEMTMAECAQAVRAGIAHTGVFDEMIKTAGPDITLEGYGRKHMTGGVVLYGSPTQIADQLDEIHEATGRNGGFMLANRARPTPLYLEPFVDLVVPILRRRGLTKTRYAPTLRENMMG
jgi:FMN-dependent oxidoreductase (nitrilotriacetate monooxygenase family)